MSCLGLSPLSRPSRTGSSLPVFPAERCKGTRGLGQAESGGEGKTMQRTTLCRLFRDGDRSEGTGRDLRKSGCRETWKRKHFFFHSFLFLNQHFTHNLHSIIESWGPNILACAESWHKLLVTCARNRTNCFMKVALAAMLVRVSSS